MSTAEENLRNGHGGGGHGHGPSGGYSGHEAHGPWKHVVGFIISIVLTLIALWGVQNHWLRWNSLLIFILALAVVQIFVQLFFFMHITESHGPRWHVVALSMGLVFTIVIVAGSMWVMTFGAMAY